MLTSGATFVVPAPGLDATTSLRGAAGAAAPSAAVAPPTPAAPADATPWLFGVVAVAAAAAVPGSRARRSRAARRAAGAVAMVAEEEALAEEEAPLPPFDPAKEIGVTAPLGYFDPLGFCKVGDYETFHKMRSAELKHGRVAMMAAAGTVFTHFVRFPIFEQTPAGLKALVDPFGFLGFFLLIVVSGFTEMFYWKDDDLAKEPGNFGDPSNWQNVLPFGMGGYTDELRNKEINNGRMAMFSIMGIIAAEIATGKDGIQQFGF